MLLQYTTINIDCPIVCVQNQITFTDQLLDFPIIETAFYIVAFRKNFRYNIVEKYFRE